MASSVVRRSFFIHHSVFGVLFVAALFFASFLLASELCSTRNVPPPVRDPIQKTDHAVLSTESFSRDSAPRVSVIVDDVGQDLALLQSLLQIQFPVTVSVLPGTEHARNSAVWANDHGFEVMVHLPMEPENFTGKDPGSNALLTSMTRKEIATRTAGLLAEIPFAAGVNNHMGSLLTSKREKMNVVLNVIAQQGFFFVDSRTSSTTVAFRLAQQKEIPTAERTLFLDNPEDILSIRARFEQLVARAKQDGTAVGICHLKAETIRELSKIEIAKYSGVRFTFASGVVSPAARTQPQSQRSIHTKMAKLQPTRR